MHTQVDFKLQFFHLTLLVIFFFSSVITDDQPGPKTKLTIIGEEDGTLVVTWQKPILVHDEGKSAIELQVDSYILSYTCSETDNQTQPINITSKETKVNISSAFLGVTYQFNLFCVINNTTIACSNQTVLALPSCPSGWYQHQMQCYYISKQKKTWSAVRTTCQKLLSNTYIGQEQQNFTLEEDINQMVADDLLKKGRALFWTATEQCKKTPEENISKFNCCISLNPGDNVTFLNSPFSTSTNFEQCSNDQELPFICTDDVKVVTVKVENVTVSMLANNSIHISWTEAPNQKGWKLAWRTVTVYSSNKKLLSTVEAKNANNVTQLPPLEPGKTYTVLIWPHKNGYITADTAATTFALIAPQIKTETNGGILQLPIHLEAQLRWDGTIHVTWDVAISKKEPNKEYEAEGYQLIYGFINSTKEEYTRVNLTKSETSYNVTAVQAGQVYVFYLKSFFGETCVGSGKIGQLKVELPAKMLATGKGGYMAYEGSSPTGQKTWLDAEKECVKRGGHLLNIESAEEEKTVANILSPLTVIWFKANECANETWSNSSSANPKCCVQIKFIMGVSMWEHTECNETLPYICKYDIPDLGLLKNLTAHKVASTTIKLKWKTPNQLWKVSVYNYCVCERQDGANCTSHSGMTTTSPVIISGLSRKTNYTITVKATIDSLKTMVTSKTEITTGHEIEVTANVSESGKILLDWSSDEDETDTSIVYIVQPQTDEVQPFRVSTNNNSIQGFKYGKEYNFTLLVVDNATGDILDSTVFNVTTKPNCLKDEFQYEMKCYFIGNQSTTWDDGQTTCRNRHGHATQIVSSNETAFLRRIAEDMDSPFWIDGKTSSVVYSNEDDNETVVAIRHRRQTQTSESGCRIITSQSENEGISVTQCGRTLPFMCQRKLTVDVGAVSNIVMENISNNEFTLKWSPPPWKPSGYDVTVTPNKPESSNSTTARRKRATTGNITIDQNSATVKDLEPATNYEVDITPIVNSPDSAEKVKGKTISFQAATLDPNATISPNMSPLTGYSDNLDAENKTTVDNEDELHTFRIISCVSLVILTLVAFVVFCICRMYRYRDCMSQMCFEVSLIMAHMLILLDTDTRDQIDCKTVAICIQFFFTSAFLFFALECFCHVKAMTKMIPLGFLNRTWQYFSVGWGVSVLIIIVAASSVHDDYVTKTQRHCWLNLDGDAMLATVIPIGIFAGMAFIFLCLAICARPETNYEVDEESYIRYDPLQDIRWMQLFMLVIFVSHWAVGMVAAHEEDGSLFIAFIVLTIVLAITILMLRCIGDDEVRFRMKACCQGSPIGPGDEDIGKYLSKPYSKKGLSSQQSGEGMLIVRKTYIFRP